MNKTNFLLRAFLYYYY